MIRAGDLRWELILQRATVTDDDFGGEVETWGELARVRVSKRDVSDSERLRAAEVGATVTARFRTHWSPVVAGVTEKDRCVCEGKVYAITATREVGYRQGFEISATARAEPSPS